MALAPHDFTAPRRMTSRPPRRMTARPSHLLLGPCPSTLDPDAAHSPVCQLWTCPIRAPKSQAHGVRHGARSRLPRVPTLDTNRLGRHHVVCAIPSSSQHLTVCAITSPSRHPTRRASAGGEGSTPNHPAALRSGMRMGFEPPEQHHIRTLHMQAGEDASSISRAGGTPGWLWNLRPGSLVLTPHKPTNRTMHEDSHKRKLPAAQRKLRPGTRDCPTRPNRPVARAQGSSSGSTV